jgi:hypothetical protein
VFILKIDKVVCFVTLLQVLILKRLKTGRMHQNCAWETDFSESVASVETERLRTLEGLRSKKSKTPAGGRRSRVEAERYTRHTIPQKYRFVKKKAAEEIYFHEAGKRGLGIGGASYRDCRAARRFKVGQRTMEAIVALCCCVSLE